MTKVTVILSTHNDERFVLECLASLADQTEADFRVLMADDASYDRTPGILEAWCRRDPRFRLAVVHPHNRGLTATLNELLRLADSPYIARMDADDVAMPHRLARQAAYLDDHVDVDVVGSWAMDIDERGAERGVRRVPETHDAIAGMMLKANPLIHPSVMFRREAIVNIGGYDERFRVAQDYFLWFRCLQHGLRFANIPEPLIRYRVHANHASRRGLKYRRIDAAVRWHGARAIGRGVAAAAGAAAIPLLLGIVPGSVTRMAMRHRDRLDPRQKARGRGTIQREERVY
jgi:glycosyltransferase involved in cell wall biosynthesis